MPDDERQSSSGGELAAPVHPDVHWGKLQQHVAHTLRHHRALRDNVVPWDFCLVRCGQTLLTERCDCVVPQVHHLAHPQDGRKRRSAVAHIADMEHKYHDILLTEPNTIILEIFCTLHMYHSLPKDIYQRHIETVPASKSPIYEALPWEAAVEGMLSYYRHSGLDQPVDAVVDTAQSLAMLTLP